MSHSNLSLVNLCIPFTIPFFFFFKYITFVKLTFGWNLRDMSKRKHMTYEQYVFSCPRHDPLSKGVCSTHHPDSTLGWVFMV